MGLKLVPRRFFWIFPFFARKGPVKTLWRVFHCFLVNNVTGRGNSKLVCHIVQYTVYASSRDNDAMLMLCIHLSACCWQYVNLSLNNSSGDNSTPGARFQVLFMTLGIVWVDVDLPNVIPSWGSERVVLELSTGKLL